MSTQGFDRFKDYVPVSERLEKFYSDHPTGRVLTSIVEHDAENGFVVIRAEVYREQDDAVPSATGHAFENRSEGYVNKTSYIENCETSATGRALALLGYEIKRGLASREEMEKTERMNGTGGQESSIICPECGDGKAVIKGKAEYGGGYVCFKKKGGCGAKWNPESKSPDEVLRDELFAKAEKLMVGYDEDKRKDALGRLAMLDTEAMGQKVNELAENARKKAKPDEGILEAERQKRIADIVKHSMDDDIDSYIAEHHPGKTLQDLSLDALNVLYESCKVPF